MNAGRRERILALAWTLPDAIAVMQSRSTDVRRPAPVAWQLCVTCDGTGTIRDRFGRPSPCGVCGGAGRYRVDPYVDGHPADTGAPPGPARITSRRVTCDRCAGGGVVPARWLDAGAGLVRCPTCDGTGRIEVPATHDDGSHEPAGDSDHVAWSIRGGDWPLLDRALERMRCNGRRPLWRAFVAAYVEPPFEVTGQAVVGLENVEAMMPARVRVPADVLAAWKHRDQRARDAAAARIRRMGRDHRNRKIREQLRLGATTADVARMFGVSERTVRRLG